MEIPVNRYVYAHVHFSDCWLDAGLLAQTPDCWQDAGLLDRRRTAG